MRSVSVIPLVLLCLSMGSYAQAQSTPSPGPSPNARTEMKPERAESDAERKVREILQANERGSGREPAPSILPEASSVNSLDPATKEQYFAAMREYYRYRVEGYQHRARIFRWQFLSSKIIFFVVILLVLSGVYFSGVQLHSSLRRSNLPVAIKEGVTQTVEHDVTEIEASVKGIRVSSPVLGVLILVISFLFFYLYLVYVYPIVDAL